MSESLSDRIDAQLAQKGWKPADLAREAKSTTATISNWRNDNIKPDHVKAVQLFSIADALDCDARWLLDGVTRSPRIAESQPAYQSHAVKPDLLRLALQLVGEALEDRGASLPLPKHAEAVQLAYDLLEEGLPQAKVLRFALAAVA